MVIFPEKRQIAVGITPSCYWFYDNLENEGSEVKLSHRLKAKTIANTKAKTDKVVSPFGASSVE
ncbi:hypothetical protein ACFLTZ_03925 [Chloroflexota bacterium]